MRPRATAIAISCALLVSGALVGCGEAGGADRVVVGEPAPLYSAQRMDGTPVGLADYRGEVVLLNVWATWCKPCRAEIPALETLHLAYAARGLVVTGVSIDAHDDTLAIAGFARELGASYMLWHDPDDRVSTTFLSIGVPSTYLIDRDGVLRWRHLGVVKADDPALLEALETALKTGLSRATDGS